ncbi:MAG TPA: HAD family hydrolase [Thermoanaerobaculia bacterium]|jgi:HAD superfamily hydrolase (TIGR01509 family)|nr:HAD family hydrolase [Thermoanaerobaculia bacterium]
MEEQETTLSSRYRGILLDVDGTLVDSNDTHADAWVRALRENGYDVSFEKIRPLMGMGGDNLLPTAVGLDKESEEGKKISERRGEIFRELLPTIRPFPGTRELISFLQKSGFQVVVATSAPDQEVDPLLEIAQVRDLIPQQTTADDAENSKPDPDIIHAALRRLGLPAEETVLLGDTRFDIEAAAKAGVGTIALRCGGATNEELAGAIAIYEDPEDLLERFEASPLAQAAPLEVGALSPP